MQLGLTFTVNEFSDIINLSDTAPLLSVPPSPSTLPPPVEWVCEMLLGLNLDLNSESAGSGSWDGMALVDLSDCEESCSAVVVWVCECSGGVWAC